MIKGSGKNRTASFFIIRNSLKNRHPLMGAGFNILLSGELKVKQVNQVNQVNKVPLNFNTEDKYTAQYEKYADPLNLREFFF